MVQALPSAPLVLGAWLAGGLMACAGGLTFAEMGAMLPRSGGMCVFLEEAYGPLVAFLFGWTMVLVVLPGGTAAVAVGFAESFSYFAPSLSTTRLLTTIPLPLGALSISAGQVVAAVSIAALAVANLFGVAAASRLAAVVTVLKVVAVVAIPVVALAVWPHTPELTPIVPPWRPLARRRDDCRHVGLRGVGVSGLRRRGSARPCAHASERLHLRHARPGQSCMLVNVGYRARHSPSRAPRVAEKAMTAIAGPLGATMVARSSASRPRVRLPIPARGAR